MLFVNGLVTIFHFVVDNIFIFVCELVKVVQCAVDGQDLVQVHGHTGVPHLIVEAHIHDLVVFV